MREDRDSGPFPRPMLTADVVAFGSGRDGASVLLVQRGNDPFAGSWALPGGFVEEAEQVARAAPRELLEETGLGTGPPLRLLVSRVTNSVCITRMDGRG